MPSYSDSTGKLRRLRWLLGILFVGLALPAALLIRQGFAQIELAEFRRQQLIAEELVRGIDNRLIADISAENARPVTDFEYAVTAFDGANNIVQLSPLASLAAAGSFPGTIGYFQVDASGQLSTPLLPTQDREVVPEAERRAKIGIETELAEVLEANRLVEFRRDLPLEERQEEAEQAVLRSAAIGSGEVPARNAGRRGQEAFDELADAAAAAPEAIEPERDQAAAPAAGPFEDSAPVVRVSAFSAELEPLRFSVLETGHFVLFRNAWREGERFVQGMLIDRDAFITRSIEPAFRNAGLAAGTRMRVATAGTPVIALVTPGGNSDDDRRANESSLYQARLSPPLARIEIDVASGTLERGPGFNLLAWTTLALASVLIGGFVAMYRFGVQQIQLARQQHNFVSAVSHELKTPLTSIRMYGEMLQSGWADEQKKQSYYDYILDEGERLSRLIDNVLQLARLNQSGPALSMEPVTLGELVDMLRSKLSTQVERAGFELEFEIAPAIGDVAISADMDALTQVFINLVDNAIKFSGDSELRKILINVRSPDQRSVVFVVRDFGPGIPPAAMKRLFELFYRPDNELTRTTAGTGIGLALVQQLVAAMSGRVDVKNRDPGAEFWLEFPRADTVPAS